MNDAKNTHGTNTHGKVTHDGYGRDNSKPCASASKKSNDSRGFAGDSADWNTSGNFGIGNGNQVRALLQAPLELSGNGIGVLGSAFAQSLGGATAVH